MKKLVVVAVLSTLLGLTASAPGQDSPGANEALLEAVGAARKETARIRGLEFLYDVPVAMISKSDFQAQMLRDIRRVFGEGEQLAHMETLLVKLGILPEGATITGLTNTFFPESVAANYDPFEKRISFLSTFRNPERLHSVMCHELTHALQDQHFNLSHIALTGEMTFDRLLALGALVEGDAENVQQIVEKGDMIRNATLEFIRGFGKMQADMYLLRKKDFPRGIARPFIFQYLDGLVFVEAIKRAGNGFAAVDRAYRFPPDSTEQILHPERYLERDLPTRFILPEMPEGWEVLVSNTLGELGVSIVLERWLGRDFTESMAAGWDGDRILLLGHGTHDPLLAWYTTWDRPEDAEEFARAAVEMLRRKYAGAEVVSQSSDQAIRLKVDGVLHGVSRKGYDVFITEGIPEAEFPATALSLVKAVKEELRIDRRHFSEW